MHSDVEYSILIVWFDPVFVKETIEYICNFKQQTKYVPEAKGKMHKLTYMPPDCMSLWRWTSSCGTHMSSLLNLQG